NTYSAAYSDFGYTTGNISGIGVTDGGTITENIALTPAPTATVSGNVNDATPSGHTYGLYSEIKVTSPAYGQVADVWTSPRGAYSVNLPEGSDYTFKATAYLPGYNQGSATITGLSGNTTQNVGVAVNAANCTAPGYQLIGGVSTGFEGTFPPTGWTVVNDVDNGFTHWERNDSYNDANFTNGSGFAAEANDDHGGPGLGAYSTQLITPPINVTSLAGTLLTYTANYDFLGTSELDLDISTDGGTTWTNIQAFNGGTGECGSLYATPGCNISVDIGSYLPGSGTFQLRWHFYSTASNAWDWYAQIDNVLLGAGCAPISGGLVTGRVRDQNTRAGLVGATVADSNTPSNSTKSITNAADPNLATGWYFLFSNTNASDVITASDSGYGNGTATLNVADNSVTNQNFALGAPEFIGTPGSYDIHVMVGTNSDNVFTIANNGTADGLASFQTFDFAPPSGSQGQGAPLNLLHCTQRLSPVSLAWLMQNQGKNGNYDPTCGNDSPTNGSPSSPAWTAITGYPGGIMDNAVATDEGTGLVYSVGGVDGSGTTTAAGNVYDPNAQTWTAIAPLPAASERPASAFIGGKLYVADGWDASGNPTATLRIYDPSTNTWSTGANNPAPEGGGVGVAVLNNKMFLIGGCPTGSSCGDTPVVSYDPASDSWTTLAPYPHAISWESCGAVSGTLYCAGGTTTSEFADGYAYDATANSWSAIASIPVAAGGLWASGYSGTSQGLLISGGITNGAITNQGFVYTPSNNTWTPLPNSINSYYRGGSACGFYKIGGSLGGFIGESNSELLAGYSPCGSSPIPWLGISKNPKPVAAGSVGHVRFRFKGAGQTEYTVSQAYLLMGGSPYAPQQIDLKVHWDPQPVDMAVVPTANLSKLYAGGNLVFYVKLRNLSDAQGPASGVTLTYPLPAGVAYLSSYGDGTCSLASGTVTCTFPNMPVGGRLDEQINVVPSIAGTLISTFTVSAREPDLNYANNTASVTTTVVAVSHVTFDSITANHPSVTVGGHVTFNMGISNKGTGIAKGVMVTLPLPANLRFTGSSSSACSNKGNVVTCNLGQLTTGGKTNVSITATAMRPGAATVTATISTTSRDSGSSHHTGTVNVTVTPPGSKPPALR
ncbi:MAG: Kelch repeat-containing protein, partial [Gammaproteobacteria bacterium]